MRVVRNKISSVKANQLITKFYEGETSKAEEKLIAQFLQSNPKLDGYEAERALFSYYSERRSQKNTYLRKSTKWLSVAASIAVLVVITLFYSQNQSKSYAYVNSKKITDQEIVYSLAVASLKSIDIHKDLPEKELENFRSSKGIIEKQLQLFSLKSNDNR